MKNKYVKFISDDHLLDCIGNLHKSYLKAKNNITKKNFYSNKVDTIKLTFDAKFNDIDEESLIQSEILRQIDKSINNSIGTFHEQVLGGIDGFEAGDLNDFNIKAKDDSLFAIFQFQEMSKHTADGIFEDLCKQANLYKKSICYVVDFYSNKTYEEKWVIGFGEEGTVSNKRVFKISADKFYALLSTEEDALLNLSNQITLILQEENFNDTVKNFQTSLHQL